MYFKELYAYNLFRDTYDVFREQFKRTSLWTIEGGKEALKFGKELPG